MFTQSKTSTSIAARIWPDLVMVGLGILAGGILALAGLWLWLDYQSSPGHSLLAILSANLIELIPATWREGLNYEAQLMGLPLSGQTPAFWYMARAGGLVSYLLLWLSTIWGLALSTKVVHDWVPAPLAYGLHEFLAIGAILFTGLHAGVLLGDRYISFNIFHLLIPFTAPYEPLWTGLGTTGFYLGLILAGSFYIRKQLGQKVWRRLHYLTFLAYGLALVHGSMAGTDSTLTGLKLIYWGTGLSVLFLTYYRLVTLKFVKSPA